MGKGVCRMRMGFVKKHLFQHLRATGRLSGLIGLVSVGVAMSVSLHGQQALQLTIDWDKTTVVSKSTPTLQVVVNPPLRHGEPLSIASYKALKELGADYVRYVPWFPYPK